MYMGFTVKKRKGTPYFFEKSPCWVSVKGSQFRDPKQRERGRTGRIPHEQIAMREQP